MNDNDRGILVGMVLGDGYIRTATARDKLMNRHVSPQIYFGHSIAQSVYAEHKVNVLNKMFGGHATLRKSRQSNGYEFVYANKSNPYFKTLKGMMYCSGKKTITRQVLDMLTPEGIAYWFMDDGSYRMNKDMDGVVSSISLTISIYSSEAEIDCVVGFFLEKYDIMFKKAFCKKTKLWYVRANTFNSRKFSLLIEKYIIPSMSYKLSCVKLLDCHECPTSEVFTCSSCGGIFPALKASGKCMLCYNKEYFNELAKTNRTCSECGKTECARYFVGRKCRACWEKRRKAKRMMI
jgi:hypothetical protein